MVISFLLTQTFWGRLFFDRDKSMHILAETFFDGLTTFFLSDMQQRGIHISEKISRTFVPAIISWVTFFFQVSLLCVLKVDIKWSNLSY
jgi:hypothetical protein